MCDVCDDDRFEVIEKVKGILLKESNIQPKELEVLDTILFRLWQCGFLKNEASPRWNWLGTDSNGMPKPKQMVLVLTGAGNISIARYSQRTANNGWKQHVFRGPHKEHYNVVAWLPLPKIPNK